MKFKTSVFFALAVILMTSCNNKSIYVISGDYEIDIQKASGFHRDFTNRYQESDVIIDAERINAKELFAALLKIDTSQVRIKADDFKNEYFTIIIDQKDNQESVRQEIIDDILYRWDLKMNSKAQPTFRLKVEDTVQYLSHLSSSEKDESKVIQTKDSIKMINNDLSQLAKLISTEYSQKVIADTTFKKIDFSFKRQDYDQFKKKIENDLGLKIEDSDKKQLIYTVESR